MPYLTAEQAADYIGYTIHSLQLWRQKGTGPCYIRVMGRSIRYRRRDLDSWMQKYGGEVVHTDQQSGPGPRLRIVDDNLGEAV